MGRRPNLVTYQGETKSISDWSESTGLSRQTIYTRLAQGWPLDRVFGRQRCAAGGLYAQRVTPIEARLAHDTLNLLYQDMKAHQRALRRTIRACLSSIEEQAASQRLTLERMLEERTRLPANVGRGVVINFDHLLSDRLSSTAQDRG